MKKLWVFIVAFALFSCHRDQTFSVGKVWVRIENASLDTFINTRVGNVEYGLVAAGSRSSYQIMPLPVYTAGCVFEINNQPAFAGQLICGTPPPPAFQPGYYTYTISPVPGQIYFAISVTKE